MGYIVSLRKYSIGAKLLLVLETKLGVEDAHPKYEEYHPKDPRAGTSMGHVKTMRVLAWFEWHVRKELKLR